MKLAQCNPSRAAAHLHCVPRDLQLNYPQCVECEIYKSSVEHTEKNPINGNAPVTCNYEQGGHYLQSGDATK
jgi:hypothetical protein